MSQLTNLGSFYSGDHKAWNLTFSDKNNTPINLNGRRIIFTAMNDLVGSDDLITLTKTFNITTDTSTLTLELNTIDTLDLSIDKVIFGVFDYDIRVSFTGNPTEIQYTALRGKLTIEKPITISMV